uniref:F-box domain-containing protein n=1 Tax=Mycena chlorophos TaxID=658473 RepID=A0ABQ0L5J7_MYCCL|nr:predicted protein [Mycena chlorophos]
MSIPQAAGFPNETWSEILQYLPRQHLQPVAAASQRFLGLSRPLLFRDITLQLCSGVAPSRTKAPQPTTAVLEEKLRFFTSVEIARNVRRLVVECACDHRYHVQPATASPDTPPSCHALGALFFEHLSRFKSVQDLVLRVDVLQAEHIARLPSLPSLRYLSTVSWDGDREFDPLQGVVPTVAVRSAALNVKPTYLAPPAGFRAYWVLPTRADSSAALRHWLEILDPRTLVDLKVTGSGLPKEIVSITRFSNLQLLTFRTDDGASFRELSLGPLTPDTFPHLHELRVCGGDVPDVFISNFPLRSLEVDYVNFANYEHDWDEAGCARIVDLKLGDFGPNHEGFEVLPRLSALHNLWVYVMVYDSEGHVDYVQPDLKAELIAISALLPRTLVSLSVDFSCEDQQLATQLQSLLNDCAPFWRALLHSILTRCPDLRHIWFETCDLPDNAVAAFCLRRAEDGRVHMEFSQDPVIMYEMREDNLDFSWEEKRQTNRGQW